MDSLEAFIVQAKRQTYVGGGEAVAASRPGSHDLAYTDGPFTYRDSYFGGTDFIGEEVVWCDGEPIWAMNYYGRILRPDVIDGATAGRIIKAALSAMYAAGRFLGGWTWQDDSGRVYVDTSVGDARSFTGQERIEVGGAIAYRLDYHGGLVIP